VDSPRSLGGACKIIRPPNTAFQGGI